MLFILTFLAIFNCIKCLNLGTTCPTIFQYGIDKINDLYGEVWIPNTENNMINLDIQVSLANSLVQGDVGRLELAFSEERIQSDLKIGKPIHYHLYFPYWENNPPRVRKIKVNNVEICKPGPGYEDSDFPVLSTINIQHYYNSAGGKTDQSNDQTVQINGSGFSDTANFGSQTVPPPPRQTNQPQTLNQYLSITTKKPPQINNINNANNKPQQQQQRPSSNNNNNNNNFKPWNQRPQKPVQPAQPVQQPNYQQTFNPYNPYEPQSERPISEICGISAIGNLLVVNGDPVPKNLFPWIVALYNVAGGHEKFICAGTLISRRHVLTAAHCLRNSSGSIFDTGHLIVGLGRHNVTNRYEGISIGPKRYFIHNEYGKDADIAVIEMAFAVSFSEEVQPICIWDETEELERIVGYKGLVVGWGKDETTNEISSIPKEAVMPIVSQEVCYNSNQYYKTVITDRTFCAGNRNGVGPCNGDSGGGFMMLRNGRWVIRGIVSMSVLNPISTVSKCDLNEFVVFTDVAKFIPWVHSIISYV